MSLVCCKSICWTSYSKSSTFEPRSQHKEVRQAYPKQCRTAEDSKLQITQTDKQFSSSSSWNSKTWSNFDYCNSSTWKAYWTRYLQPQLKLNCRWSTEGWWWGRWWLRYSKGTLLPKRRTNAFLPLLAYGYNFGQESVEVVDNDC